jgi:hypothetical protein
MRPVSPADRIAGEKGLELIGIGREDSAGFTPRHWWSGR